MGATTLRVACSACGSVIGAGDQRCPGCGLQLGALAVPVRDVPPRPFPLWALVVLAFIGLMVLGGVLDNARPSKSATLKTVWMADVAAGRLDSPAVFQERCGDAAKAWSSRRGQFLSYGDLVVWFPKAGHVSFGDDVAGGIASPLEQGEKVDADFAWSQLNCH